MLLSHSHTPVVGRRWSCGAPLLLPTRDIHNVSVAPSVIHKDTANVTTMTELMRRSVYRAFLRELNGWRKVAPRIPSKASNDPSLGQRDDIYLADALKAQKFGTYEFIGPPSLYRLQNMFGGIAIPQQIEDQLEEHPHRCSLSVDDARLVIRHNAKHPNLDARSGLQHYRAFADCLSNNLCTAVTSKQGIAVELTTNLIPSSANVTLDDSPFQYMYRFRISNFSSEVFQILSRHLHFVDETEMRLEVPYGSPGVIGQQPELKPGQTFQYYSGVGLGGDGFMEGSFQVRTRSNDSMLDIPFGPACFMAVPTVEKLTRLLNADSESFPKRTLM
eukprot:gb/GECG01006590.1/.p1 GENE.gb/GECG01006590.1/~~gb/GECG01006590.1/.p1  ORF type:complete len:331 (+),score=21.85 gb/GECG01006590.1/:1-993(+)